MIQWKDKITGLCITLIVSAILFPFICQAQSEKEPGKNKIAILKSQTFEKLIKEVEQVKLNMTSMSKNLREARIQANQAGEKFDNLISDLRTIIDLLGKDGEIMTELNANVETMKGYFNEAKEKIETSTQSDKIFWVDDANYWEKELKEIGTLRERLNLQVKTIKNKMVYINENKERVIALTRRIIGEKTKELLIKAADDLEKINEGLDNIINSIPEGNRPILSR